MTNENEEPTPERLILPGGMTGLQKILRAGGKMKVTGRDGKTVTWVWDYVKEQSRKKEEMSKEEWLASEKKKWENVRNQANGKQ